MTDFFRSNFIKKFARQALKGKWLRSFAVMLLGMIILRGPLYITSYLTSSTRIQSVVVFIMMFLMGPVMMGFTTYFVDTFRGVEEPGLNSFGRGFTLTSKSISLFVMYGIVVFVPLMLFVVPGIITAIIYSQSFFILADNPDMSIYACMRTSREMMYGRKLRFLSLQLSFIGWLFLASLPASIAMTRDISFIGPATSLESDLEALRAAAEIPHVRVLTMIEYIVFVYQFSANACFYDMISGNLKMYVEVSPENYETKGIY